MKKSLIIIFTICFSAIVTAQESDKNNADYDFGNGISFSFNGWSSDPSQSTRPDIS